MLREDHRILLLLLNRCGQASDCHSRRDIMQLVVDLFEVHSAICAQTRLNGESMPERLAVSELMDQVEGTDARSRLHFARSVALAPVLEAYVARGGKSWKCSEHAGIPLHLEHDLSGNRALLRASTAFW